MEKFSIKHWEESDRPREKMVLTGPTTLSLAELLAILMGSGNREENAVELARRILRHSDDSLIKLSKMSIKEFMKFKGVGEAKAVSIVAALELGKRRMNAESHKKKSLTSSQDAFEAIRGPLMDLRHEEFWIIMLDRANHIISTRQISEGGFTGTVADPKKIFRLALEFAACGLILCHNHPSNNLKPSDSDCKLTKKIVQAGAVLDINVLDHLIVGETSYYSFMDEGMMP